MKFLKRKKKEDPKAGQKVLRKIDESLTEGEPNEQIDYIQKVLKKSWVVPPIDDKKLGDINDYVKFMKESQAKFDADRKKQLKEMKKQNTFWFKTRAKIRAKYADFVLNMEEITSFIRHEFYTIRRLVFLINDLFFGAQHKNRKLLYGHKDKIIKVFGYRKGEIRFNEMCRNITKSADINKRIRASHG